MREHGLEYPDVRLARAVLARHRGYGVDVTIERSMARSRVVLTQEVLVDYDPASRTRAVRHIPFMVFDITEIEDFAAAWEEYVGGPVTTRPERNPVKTYE